MNQLLKKIRQDLHGLQPDDQTALIQMGAALQQFVAEVPPEASLASDLLMACLSGLQAIYQQTYADFSQLKDAINSATVAVEQVLTMPESSLTHMIAEEAREAINLALRAASASTTTSADEEVLPAVSDEPIVVAPVATLSPLETLDDASAFFMQMQAEDRAALAHLRDALKAMVMGDGLAPEIQKLVIRAGKVTEQLLYQQAEDVSATFAEVGRWLNEAALAQDFAAHGGHHAPPVVPSTPPASLPAVSAPPPVVTPSVPGAAPVEAAAPVLVESVATAMDFGLLPSDTDTALVGEFIIESNEYLEGAEAALLALESDPDNLEAVNTVFRAFHTIKGTSAFLGLDKISTLAHRAESLLSRVRDREIRCTGGYADLALRSVDMLKDVLASVQDALQGTAIKKPAGYDELMRLLANPEAAGVSADANTAAMAPPASTVAAPVVAAPIIDAPLPDVAPPPVPATAAASVAAAPVVAPPAPAAMTNASGEPARSQARPAQAAPSGEESFLRVRTNRLDRLIDMVGELVIAQSMIAQDETILNPAHQDLSRKTAHAGKIVRELQDLSMSMRMVPLKATFQKMTRLVRDVAQKSGKLVEFETEGEDTEIDRNMVDVIGDPLVHMIRNAVDHGIELPSARVEKGKPQQGTVRLAAYHAGGYVVVELQDDGKGLDRDKIVSKAIEKGLIESDKGMSSGDVFNLIFAPGFSTADQVSDLSGRGVGMDVVKRNIESLRGRIHISSEAGKGTLFMMRLPLTLAITDGMLVRIGAERYIISTINIFLSFQPTADSISTVAGRGEMVMLRGELMPLYRLHQLFDVPGAIEDPTKALLVVVADGKRRCALLVDELLGQQQVVAKSLGNGIGKIQGISGGAILGDGRVGLIIDVPEVVALVRKASNAADRKPAVLQAAA